MTKVLFVCLGNICRSPMAEAVFRQKLKEAGLEMSVDSCGTAAYHIGENPDPRTVKIVSQNNVPIDHVVRRLSSDDFYQFDYILAMDRSNLSDINYQRPQDSKSKIGLMRDFDPQPENGEVPDPYYGGSNGFKKVFDIIDRSAEALLEYIINNK